MSEGVAAVEDPMRAGASTAVRRGGRVRVVFRCVGAVGWTVASGLAVALVAVTRPIPSVYVRWRRRVIQTWARGVARVVGMRITTSGNPPAPPYLMVSNHLGYLDIILLAAETGCNFVSRHDVRDWPGFGVAARAAGTLFVDRGRKRDAVRAMVEVSRHLERGIGVTLFPEGTSTKGDKVYPMKGTMLELAAQRNVPVHYVTVGYRTPLGAPPAHRLICWWGNMDFGPHFFELLRWPHFDATLSFGPTPIQETDRKRLAERLRNAIAARFVPVTEEDV